MPPRRVVLMVDNLHVVGGAERLVEAIALELDRARYEPTVWVTRPILGRDASLRAAGVPVHVLQRKSTYAVGAWAPFVAAMRRMRPHILHAHKFGSNVWASFQRPLLRVPVFVAHEHSWSYEGSRARILLDRHLVSRRADAFVAVSREDRRRMIEIECVPEDKARYVPLGIDPARPSGRDVRAELGIAAHDPLVVAVGGLRTVKRIDLLLRATARLREAHPRLALLLVGDGPQEAELRDLTSELALGDTVRFLGHRTTEDVADVVAAADVAVNCSDSEGTPLVVMEYMALGIPVVATRVGGVPDIVEAGVHGLIVDRGDEEGLAAAIGRLLADRALAQRLGDAARRRQQTELTVGAMVRRLEDLYDELLARKVSPRCTPS